MMMFGDHSFVAFVDNDDIGAVFVRHFLKGPRYDFTKCNYFMWPPWLSVNITHCSVWSVFVVCDGDNYCLCVAVVVVVVVDWHHLDNEVSPLAALCDPVEAVGVVDGGVPGGKAAHLSSYYLIKYCRCFFEISPLLPPRPAPPAAVRRISLQAPEKKTSFSRKGFFYFLTHNSN